jgi:CheY-like chemotaxis protein
MSRRLHSGRTPRAGSGVSVTYYTGNWVAEDRAAVREILADNGLNVTGETEGVVKGVGEFPLQLLIDVGQEALKAATDQSVDVLLAGIVVALHNLFGRFRERKPNVVVTINLIRYVVSDEQSIDDIPIDYRTSFRSRTGERWWREGRWQTYDEMYGKS